MTLSEIRRRPTLPGRFQPSTISVLRLNFCVRDGNRWIPQAIVTGNMGLSRSLAALLLLTLSHSLPLRFLFLAPSKPHRFAFASLRLTMAPFRYSLRHSLSFAPPSGLSSALASVSLLASLSSQIIFSDQALDRLVSSSSIRYRTSTDDLSTLSSSRGLTCF